jgi:hypothetical protein
MRVKTVKVLDDATEMWFLVGKPDQGDQEMLESVGWEPDVTLLVHIRSGGGVEACMSSFKGYIKYDLEEYGPMEASGTTVKLAKIIRDMLFEDIPVALDVRDYD